MYIFSVHDCIFVYIFEVHIVHNYTCCTCCIQWQRYPIYNIILYVYVVCVSFATGSGPSSSNQTGLEEMWCMNTFMVVINGWYNNYYSDTT